MWHFKNLKKSSLMMYIVKKQNRILKDDFNPDIESQILNSNFWLGRFSRATQSAGSGDNIFLPDGL